MGGVGPAASLGVAAAVAILAVIVACGLCGASLSSGASLEEPFRGPAGPPPAVREARDARPPPLCPDPEFSPDLSYGYPYSYALESPDPAGEGVNLLYSSAEVDPRVTGQLYAGARAAGSGRQWVYGNRTSFGDRWGMREFSSGVPGQTGVDVGPFGMCAYSLDGKPDVFDDGIPAQWRLPSTPVNWYKPRQRDYFDVESQTGRPYAKDLVSLREPDHEPLFG